MKSRENTKQSSQTSAPLVLLFTLGLTAASLLGPNPVQAVISRYAVVVWALALILSYLTFRNRLDQGLLLLVQAIALLTGIGLYLEDARQVPFGIFGGFIWGAVLIASFVFGLLYFAQFVLPLKGNEGWSEGVRLLARHSFISPPPGAPSTDKKPGSSKSDDASVNDDLPASLSTLKAGIVSSHDVLALTKGSGFSRPAGPGFVMLYKGEKIADRIDLRKHLRTEPVKATTRDGIPLETNVHVTFRVKQEESDQADEELQHPYDRDAIFNVSYANTIGEMNVVHPWRERLAPIAADMLVTELSQYQLDDLFQGDEAGIPILDAIKERMQDRLEAAIGRDGIEVLQVAVDQFRLPQRVIDQRIKTWQADWKRKIQMQKASGDAEVLRRIKKARARTQIEIIENITQNIQAVRRSSDSELSEIIMLRMIEALEKAASDESIHTMIPQQVMAHLVMDSTERLLALVKQPVKGAGG